MRDSNRESIEKFYQLWFGAMEQADIDGFLSLIEEDFYFKGPGQPAVQDKETLRSFLEQFHQNFTETVEWEIDEIRLFDSHAVVRVLEEVTLVPKQTGDPTKIEGVHFSLLSRKQDGSWRLQTDVSSLNHQSPDLD